MYSLKVSVIRNGNTATDYNPDSSHMTHVNNTFYVVMDNSGLTTEIILSINIRQPSSFTNYTSRGVKLTPSTSFDF